MKGILNTRTYRKHLFALFCTLASFYFASAQNPIVTENALPGNPIEDWGIDPTILPTIEGFATDISVNRGGTVHFKVKSSNVITWKIDIYRLGYYGGLGARLVNSQTKFLTGSQPAPLENAALGLVDCGNWAENASWAVPASAVPGLYIAKVSISTAANSPTNSSHIPFVVRDDASTADILFQTSDATWQAYNAWGGNSLYTGTTTLPSGRAAKVSYNRPFMTRSGGGGGGTMDYLFNAEYPMIRFMERNGYNMSYTTNVDMARSATQMTNHKVFLSVGHDEYWSKEQRDNVESARNAGKHLAFFSGNEVYWKTRWENSISSGTAAFRTLVCYKEGTLGEAVCPEGDCDPTNIWTGLWRDGCSSTNTTIDGCKPEAALTGQMSWENSLQAMKVP
ncbi:MAG TPA: N,N-dimethylformamidase beta subunit family domain-containing protein, partial [Chitinophagaceae bacterium]|nr:N,N-dimethylformamidase beta subunit family domain-containing protein [Chitinophagaceae bacterium]